MAQSPPEAKTLPQPPTDGITALAYLSPNSSGGKPSLLASTSWDGSVRIHDTQAMTLVTSHVMESGPLLSLAALSDSTSGGGILVTGGLDGTVRKFDISTSTVTIIGKHSGNGDAGAASNENTQQQQKVGCSCLVALQGPYEGLVGSAGWDGMFHLWDTTQTTAEPMASIQLPGKAFGMDYDPTHHRIVIGCSGRKMVFLQVRTTTTPQVEKVLERESSLKYQTRTVQFFPDGSGLAVGSIEGRVAVEFLDDLGISSNGMKKYAFKCHRDGDVVYPVNTIAFHPHYGTFATGGCDGTVVTWDGLHKKKLTTLPKFTTSIAALAFNHDGSELAIASSYTFEEGERDHPRDEIYVRQMLESECKPKQAS